MSGFDVLFYEELLSPWGFFVSISIILRNEGQDLPTWGHLLLANLSFEFLVIEKSTYLILKDLDGENGVCVHGCIFFICLFMQLSPNPHYSLDPNLIWRANEFLSHPFARMCCTRDSWTFAVLGYLMRCLYSYSINSSPRADEEKFVRWKLYLFNLPIPTILLTMEFNTLRCIQIFSFTAKMSTMSSLQKYSVFCS